MTLKDADLALTYACPICAEQPCHVCAHMAERLALAESMQPGGTDGEPTPAQFDQAAEESGLV